MPINSTSIKSNINLYPISERNIMTTISEICNEEFGTPRNPSEIRPIGSSVEKQVKDFSLYVNRIYDKFLADTVDPNALLYKTGFTIVLLTARPGLQASKAANTSVSGIEYYRHLADSGVDLFKLAQTLASCTRVEVEVIDTDHYFLYFNFVTTVLDNEVAYKIRFSVCKDILQASVIAGTSAPIHVDYGEGLSFFLLLAKISEWFSNPVETEYILNKVDTNLSLSDKAKKQLYRLRTALLDFNNRYITHQTTNGMPLGIAGFSIKMLHAKPLTSAIEESKSCTQYCYDLAKQGVDLERLTKTIQSCSSFTYDLYDVAVANDTDYQVRFTFSMQYQGKHAKYTVNLTVINGVVHPVKITGKIPEIPFKEITDKSFIEVLAHIPVYLERDLQMTSNKQHNDSTAEMQEPEEYVHVLDNGKTETESQRMARMEAALEVVLDIGSRDYGGGLAWVDYLRDAMKFRVFMHKFNNTNFAKHLGLVFSHDAHEVKFCGHRVSQLKYFLTNHYSFFKPGGLDMFETFGEIAVSQSSSLNPKKAKLNVNRQQFVFTVYDVNGELEKETIDNQDLKIKFYVFPHDLRDEWLNYNGVENIPEEPTARDDYEISLLEYLSYLNSQFVKTAESRN